MRSVYQCERCGKLFTGDNAMDACRVHEDLHYLPADRYSLKEKPEEYSETIIHNLVYDDKHLEPVSFIAYLQNQKWDEEKQAWVDDTIQRKYTLSK